MKIKTSWTRLMIARNVCRYYLGLHPEKTRIEYAMQRTVPRADKTESYMHELLDGIDADHAVTGKVDGVDGVILKDEHDRYRFTPEGRKKCTAARSKLLNDPEGVEFDAYFATAIPIDHACTDDCGAGKKPGRCACGKPVDLTESELDALEGIVIRAEDVERIRMERETRLEGPEGSTEHAVQ